MEDNYRTKKEKCGTCEWYDLWTGICINVDSPIFDTSRNDSISEQPSCSQYQMEQSFREALKKDRKVKKKTIGYSDRKTT